jgi:hypothetical protein
MLYEACIAIASVLGISSLVLLSSPVTKQRLTDSVEDARVFCKSKYERVLGQDKADVSKVGDSHFEVRYTVAGREFRMIAEPATGPPPFFEIRDHTGKDITDKIVPYIGPSWDWHGKAVTPRFFGVASIIFLCDTADHKFDEYEVLPPLKELELTSWSEDTQKTDRNAKRPSSA